MYNDYNVFASQREITTLTITTKVITGFTHNWVPQSMLKVDTLKTNVYT